MNKKIAKRFEREILPRHLDKYSREIKLLFNLPAGYQLDVIFESMRIASGIMSITWDYETGELVVIKKDTNYSQIPSSISPEDIPEVVVDEEPVIEKPVVKKEEVREEKVETLSDALKEISDALPKKKEDVTWHDYGLGKYNSYEGMLLLKKLGWDVEADEFEFKMLWEREPWELYRLFEEDGLIVVDDKYAPMPDIDMWDWYLDPENRKPGCYPPGHHTGKGGKALPKKQETPPATTASTSQPELSEEERLKKVFDFGPDVDEATRAIWTPTID